MSLSSIRPSKIVFYLFIFGKEPDCSPFNVECLTRELLVPF